MPSANQLPFYQASGITFEQPDIRAPAPKRRRYATTDSNSKPLNDVASDVAQAGSTPATVHTTTRTRSQRQATDASSAPSPARSLRSRTTTIPSMPAPARRVRALHSSQRFTSAGAAALAVSQGDGYKPREERGWEEFHPDLDIDAKIAVFSAEEVDGIVRPASNDDEQTEDHASSESRRTKPVRSTSSSSSRRSRRGRWNSKEPKLAPPPIPIVSDSQTSGSAANPKMTLPKPHFTRKDPFEAFESDRAGQQNYVDRTMASVGYQESDIFVRNFRGYIRMMEGAAEEDFDLDASASDGNPNAAIGGAGVGRVEYDMDEQDEKWLEEYNEQRKAEQYEPIKPAIFEITMTKIEKEWYALEKRIPKPNPKPPQTQRPRSSSAAAVIGEHEAGEEPDTKCAVCDDGDCENANAIVFCDGCDLAVHQECYGVPYIPEGQWLCRKCQLVGPGSPCCSFCPNTEGAFKQTNTSKWAHLLCAIWIPEVSLGSPTLMEPIIDVEKIPKSRWKLNCYICRQKMGACIQCANKNCFVAFHITCARRARLYTKMKISPSAPAVTDSQGLKAFCDKHVPDDWRDEHDTDDAVLEAMEYYRMTMAGRKWPDSQAAALSLGPDSDEEYEPPDNTQQNAQASRLTLTVSGNKRKRTIHRTVWKMPSGAPVIPQVILNSVIVSLGRFTVRQRKQYAEDACKYWTLKREARRGAALLKRLQLQLETFSSMEMTRRNFAGMGVAGAVRLQRRIAFAKHLYTDVDRVRMLCDEVKKRERDKLKDAEMLRHIVDLVYYPIMDLMWPIFDKAVKLDAKTRHFNPGLLLVREKLEMRAYGSIAEFSRDLANTFTEELGINSVGNPAQLLAQMGEKAADMDTESKEKRKLAKRIMKAIQPLLEDALRKESELSGRPFEKELHNLDALFSGSVLGRGGSEAPADITVVKVEQSEAAEDKADADAQEEERAVQESETVQAEEHAASEPTSPHTAPSIHDDKPECVAAKAASPDDAEGQYHEALERQPSVPNEDSPGDAEPAKDSTTPKASTPQPGDDPIATEDPAITEPAELAGPGVDANGDNPLCSGGIMWYMEPFDPVGTTIHEERWTGREVLRDMSEELSDFDEEEIRGLIEDELGSEKTASRASSVGRGRGGRSRGRGRAASASPRKEEGIERGVVARGFPGRRPGRGRRRRRWY